MPQIDRWTKILADVESRQSFLDSLCSSAAADYRSKGGEIFCDKGCSGCCTLAVNCTAGEALLIAKMLAQEQRENLKGYVARLKNAVPEAVDLKDYLRLHRKELGGCPFLVGGICSVYAVRPLSCRALLSSKNSYWCAADFSELPAAEKRAFVESLDREAVAFPMHYLACTQKTGQTLEAETLMQLMKEFGCSLYGSMPVLVFLFLECALQEAIANGADAVLAAAASAGLDSPFLLQVDTL